MDIFSNLQVIGECLLDVRRTRAFEKAIEATVRPGDMVMDVGTGSSILGMMSVRAGAHKVYGVEIAEDVANFAKGNVHINGLSEKMEIISADIKSFNFPHEIDVVTMELLDTWLIAEQEAVAMNRLRKIGVIGLKTKLIPYRYQCFLRLVEYDFNFYGFKMPFVIQARNFAALQNIKKILSKKTLFSDVSFRDVIQTEVNSEIIADINGLGKFNALILEAKTFLSPGQAIWGTTDLNMPVIVPVSEISVKKGDIVKVHIAYEMGEGFGKFKAKCQKV